MTQVDVGVDALSALLEARRLTREHVSIRIAQGDHAHARLLAQALDVTAAAPTDADHGHPQLLARPPALAGGERLDDGQAQECSTGGGAVHELAA